MIKADKKKSLYSRHVIEKDIRHHLVEWIASLCTIVGAIMIAYIIKEGFYIFCVGNILWILFSIKHKHWGLLTVNIILFIINVFSLYNWS